MIAYFSIQKIAYDFIKTYIVHMGKEAMLSVLALTCLFYQE